MSNPKPKPAAAKRRAVFVHIEESIYLRAKNYAARHRESLSQVIQAALKALCAAGKEPRV